MNITRPADASIQAVSPVSTLGMAPPPSSGKIHPTGGAIVLQRQAEFKQPSATMPRRAGRLPYPAWHHGAARGLRGRPGPDGLAVLWARPRTGHWPRSVPGGSRCGLGLEPGPVQMESRGPFGCGGGPGWRRYRGLGRGSQGTFWACRRGVVPIAQLADRGGSPDQALRCGGSSGSAFRAALEPGAGCGACDTSGVCRGPCDERPIRCGRGGSRRRRKADGRGPENGPANQGQRVVRAHGKLTRWQFGAARYSGSWDSLAVRAERRSSLGGGENPWDRRTRAEPTRRSKRSTTSRRSGRPRRRRSRASERGRLSGCSWASLAWRFPSSGTPFVKVGPADVLQLGHPALRIPSERADVDDPGFREDGRRLLETLDAFRRRFGFGRAVAAPQIGVARRVIAIDLGQGPFLVVNPEITWWSDETFTMWDDCMCFPALLVRLSRHRAVSLTYTDEQGRPRQWPQLDQAASELLQHEIDHLDGILAIDRAESLLDVISRETFERFRLEFDRQVGYGIR